MNNFNSNPPTQIMAIINTSPDSFSGDGLSDEVAIRRHLQKALDEGADILDIGGQSTRPGAEIVPADVEIVRVVPAIKIARQLTDKPISIDTFKPTVARAALEAGATMVNDVRGAADPEIIKVVQEANCPIIIMHSRGDSKSMSGLTEYPNGVVNEVRDFLATRAQGLMDAGIAKESIIIDPGIGFAKTAAQSFELTRALNQITTLGYPVLYGASQKSFIGKTLGTNDKPVPVEERAVGTTVVQSYAMLHGANIIRVHDVRVAVQTRTVVQALRQGVEHA